MKSYFSICGREIPIYGFCGMIGFLASLLFIGIITLKKTKIRDDAMYIFTFSVIGSLVGAKILYLIVNISPLLKDIQLLSIKEWIYKYISGGYVFLGGLIGALMTFYGTCRFFGTDYKELLSILVPTIPLMHAFGRIGCFCVGCCHGEETNSPFYVIYTQSEFAPNNISLVPIQLYESIFEFMIFFILTLIYVGRKYTKYMLPIYIISYSIFRFIGEFFRGDVERGFLFGLSTSQWLSILLMLFAISYCILPNRHKMQN